MIKIKIIVITKNIKGILFDMIKWFYAYFYLILLKKCVNVRIDFYTKIFNSNQRMIYM